MVRMGSPGVLAEPVVAPLLPAERGPAMRGRTQHASPARGHAAALWGARLRRIATFDFLFDALDGFFDSRGADANVDLTVGAAARSAAYSVLRAVVCRPAAVFWAARVLQCVKRRLLASGCLAGVADPYTVAAPHCLVCRSVQSLAATLPPPCPTLAVSRWPWPCCWCWAWCSGDDAHCA